MQALTLLRIQAHGNRLANHRLHTSMAALSLADLHATRTSFFPTLMDTLNHILWVDGYYIDVLHAAPDARERALAFVPEATLSGLAQRQQLSDERLLRWLAAGAQQWVIFCAIGWRSALAAKTLQDMGLAGVSHLGGGFRAWVAAGGVVEPWTKKD